MQLFLLHLYCFSEAAFLFSHPYAPLVCAQIDLFNFHSNASDEAKPNNFLSIFSFA